MRNNIEEQSCREPNPSELEALSTPIDSQVIERVLQVDPEEFARNYPGWTVIGDKYRLVRDLITDGRFTNPTFLFDHFLPKKIPEEHRSIAQPLKEQLQLQLVQEGIVSPDTVDEETSERILHRELQKRQDFKDLVADGWPPEVIGQLMTIDLFTDISDARKLEELRSWVSRGMIREYIGVIKGKVPRKDLAVFDLMDRIPKRIFSDPSGIKFHLVEHYLESRLMKSITDAGLCVGLASMDALVEEGTESDKKRFLEGIRDRFYDIATEPQPGDFKQTILLKGQEREVPSFEQRAAIYNYRHHNTRLITAGTGLGKTRTAYGMFEASDAQRCLVLGPAAGRATWPIEAEKHYNNCPDVCLITGSSDIEPARQQSAKFTSISYELLGLAGNDPKLSASLEQLVRDTEMDGEILDEIDEIRNPKASSTQMAVKLTKIIRENYARKHDKPKVEAPVIGLTATPLRKGLLDLNVAMSLLYPDDFAMTHGESTATKKTFSDTHLNRPDLSYFSLIGEKRMFRWEQATGVQEFGYETVVLEPSPFEEYLYAFIANEVPTDALNKIRILEDSLFNPLLVKAEVRTLAGDKIPDLDIDETVLRLSVLAREWKKKRGVDEPVTEDDYLSADRLVELGMGEMVLSCFFSDLLENGIDTLVDEYTREAKEGSLLDLKSFWKNREISTKYQKLKKIIQDSLEWKIGPDGKQYRDKVFIVSPSRRQGRTGDVLQREITLENGDRQKLYADYELDTINDTVLLKHVEQWVKECCGGEVLLLDGTVPVGKTRDEVINRWTDEPEAVAMVTTLEAVYQSRDFTLNKIEDTEGRRIGQVTQIVLSPPWYHQKLRQLGGRSARQGQLVPLDMKVFETRGLVDQAKGDVCIVTHLQSGMALSGIVLTPDQQALYDSRRVGSRIPLQSKEARFLRDVFFTLRGKGEDEAEACLSKLSSTGEKTHDQLIAESFYAGGRDAYRTTGYNAELAAYLAKNLVEKDANILSLGSGTLLFQRKLQRGVDNVDLNACMMEAGWTEAQQYGGKKIVGRASSLSEEEFPSENYDLVESAFALDWSSLGTSAADSERVKILSQVNRVLKQDGKFILTLPESTLDRESFRRLTEALENHFGFEVMKEFSGRSFGRSRGGISKRLGWSIVAQKVGSLDLDGLHLSGLEFATGDGTFLSYPGKKRKSGRQVLVGTPDYPSPDLKIDFDRYEIVNADNEVTVVTYDEDLPGKQSKEEEKGEQIVSEEPLFSELRSPEQKPLSLKFLKGKTGKEYRAYRKNLLRWVSDLMECDWEKAEDLCADVFRQLQEKHGRIKDREEAYELIKIEIEIRKMAREEVNINAR